VNVLVLNCGSSSVKFQILSIDEGEVGERAEKTGDAGRGRTSRLARGMVENVGGDSAATFEVDNEKEARPEPERVERRVADHRGAIDLVLRWVASPDSGIDAVGSLEDIHAVGHRVVHGGERFQDAVLIDEEVLAGIEECSELAPLHNPANLKGIRAARELLGGEVPQAAVFDTAFHAGLPEAACLYGLPYDLYRRHGIRRYGFHGTSHRFVALRYAELVGIRPDEANLITLHLGNGCSACAVRGGKSVDTSMGFTPLEGLLMGTRSGDIDPGVLPFLAEREGKSLVEINDLLNRESGLLGVSGVSRDMRELLDAAEKGNDRARLAIAIFAYRARKYVGAYSAVLDGADAVVFTGGIGENAPSVRAAICEGLGYLGLDLDPARNEQMRGGKEGEISRDGSRLRAHVIPTDEELMIARDTVRVMSRTGETS
jgi:acetate kinase